MQPQMTAHLTFSFLGSNSRKAVCFNGPRGVRGRGSNKLSPRKTSVGPEKLEGIGLIVRLGG
jgi:hypothetical protein